MTVQVVEPDDGSGWVKVLDPRGKRGLVPASYLGSDDSHSDTGQVVDQGSGQRGLWLDSAVFLKLFRCLTRGFFSASNISLPVARS